MRKKLTRRRRKNSIDFSTIETNNNTQSIFITVKTINLHLIRNSFEHFSFSRVSESVFTVHPYMLPHVSFHFISVIFCHLLCLFSFICECLNEHTHICIWRVKCMFICFVSHYDQQWDCIGIFTVSCKFEAGQKLVSFLLWPQLTRKHTHTHLRICLAQRRKKEVERDRERERELENSSCRFMDSGYRANAILMQRTSMTHLQYTAK